MDNLKTVYISFCADINMSTSEQLLAVTFQMIQQGYTQIYF